MAEACESVNRCAFAPALTLAHRLLAALEIFFLAAADRTRFLALFSPSLAERPVSSQISYLSGGTLPKA